jgi:sulfide:quinone oxidoreductase
MAHIVVIGAGVGGVPCAYELRKKLAKEHRVTLVGSSPYFEFTPSNPWIAVGRRKCEQTRVEMMIWCTTCRDCRPEFSGHSA